MARFPNRPVDGRPRPKTGRRRNTIPLPGLFIMAGKKGPIARSIPGQA